MRSLLLMLVILSVASAGDAGAQTVRVLAIGNSFSGNALSMLPDIAKAAGCTVEREVAFIEGGTMQQHWERHEKSLADPANKAFWATKTGPLRETLRAKPWDVVTIQQGSMSSPDISTYRPYAAQLLALIRSEAPQAQALVHQTWAYRVNNRMWPKDCPDQATMYRNLNTAYTTIAKELGLALLPVGDAFFAADNDPVWGLKILKPDWNPKTAVYPEIPDNGRSMHKGAYWVKGKDGSYGAGFDGGHAGPNGCYIAGCVWFEVLFKRSVIGNTYRPEGMPEDYARFLQETAHRAVVARNPVKR